MRRTIIVFAALLLAASSFAAMFGLWAESRVVDRAAFVESSLVSFGSPGSDEALGEVMASKVVDRYPALSLFESVLRVIFSALVATEEFAPALDEVANEVHDAVIGGTGQPIVIDLAVYEDAIVGSVTALSPELAALIPPEVFTTFVVFDADEVPDASGAANALVAVAWVSVVIAVAMVLLIMLYARDAALAFAAIGGALMIAALGIGVMVPLGRDAAGTSTTSDAYRVLSRNLYDVLVQPLTARALLVGLAGAAMLVVAAVAWSAQRR
ncbi:MAG TPA: hypothetical protein VLA29_08345 [Acidimicrobiia bacterium]|nr:hypothetical protein [Acidimicrobiia bacterium]